MSFGGRWWLRFLFAAVGLLASRARAETDAVAVSGQAAPDATTAANGMFDTFAGIPVINDDGLVAFKFRLEGASGGFTDSPTGIWVGDGVNSLRQIVRQSDPTSNGIIGTISGGPTLNRAGIVGFQAGLNDTTGGFGVDDLAAFLSSGSGLSEVIRSGTAAPGGDGVVVGLGVPYVGESGVASVLISYGQTVSGIPERAIITGSGGGFSEVAREKRPADGGGSYSRLFGTAVKEGPDVAFRASVTGGTGNDGIFLGVNGSSPIKLARATEASPDGDGYFFSFNSPQINTAGQVAFRAVMSSVAGSGVGTEEALFVSGGGMLTKIARENDMGPGGAFEGSFEFSLNNHGVLGFTGSIDAGTESVNGVYRGSGGLLTPIAKQGGSAVGNGKFLFFGDPAINDANVVAFQGGIELTPGGGATERGLFLGDGEDLVEVVRTGAALGGGTVNEVNFAGGDNDFGGNKGLNRYGQVTYQATLESAFNGRQGIFLFTPDLHWRRIQPVGFWDTGDNWTLGLNPGKPHDVYIDPATDVTVTGPVTNGSIESLVIGGNTGAAKLLTQESSVLSVRDGLRIGPHGTLAGDGTIMGEVTAAAGGTISPGDDIGMLTVGDVKIETASVLRLDLGGSGTGLFDVLIVDGSIELSGNIQLILSYAPSEGDKYVVIANDGTDPILGIFGNGPVTAADFGGTTYYFAIDYKGGTGNDLELTVIPEPSAGILASAASIILMGTRRNRKLRSEYAEEPTSGDSEVHIGANTD